MCVYTTGRCNTNQISKKKMYILILVFFFFSMTVSVYIPTPVATTTMPTTTTTRTIYRIPFDSISVFLVLFFLIFFFIILVVVVVVLVAAEVFLPIIFFVNWLGSHAARVSRRRLLPELADRLPPPTTIPLGEPLSVTLFLPVFSLSLSLSLTHTHSVVTFF